MTEVGFIRLWWRLKPAQVKRKTWLSSGLRIYAIARAITLPVRHPRLWWFVTRVRLHYAYGLPLPLSDRQRGRLSA